MAGLPGLPPPGFSQAQGLPGLPAPGFSNNLNTVSGQVGKGLTFGFFDELQGLEAGAQESLRNLFGVGSGKSFSDAYGAKVKDLRAADAAFEAANPKTALALQVAGGIAPALATAGASAAPAGAGLLRSLFGVGLKEAPTAGQLFKMGATGGALFGAGEANEKNRLLGAAKGGAIGGVAAPIVGKAVQFGLNKAADAATNSGLMSRLASERGTVFGGQTSEALTPGEALVAKELRNVPLEKVRQAAQELQEAVDSDVPLFLPEAVQSAKIDRNARYIANYEPSMDFAQEAIKTRTVDASNRAGRMLDAVSPAENAFQGAGKLAKAADDIIKKAEGERAAISGPWYQRAYSEKPVIRSTELDELLDKDQILGGIIKNVKRSFENADLPDTSTQVLVKARGRLWDKIDDLRAKGQGQEARDLEITYNRLAGILHRENPALAQADNAFASASTGIDDLTSTFLSNLQKLSDDKILNIGQIFNLPAERIKDLRARFDNAGKLSEWNAGIRSYIQNAIESTGDGRNFALKLVGSQAQRGKLEAALGDKANSVVKGLKLESRMFEGKNKYHTGSTTYGNIAEEKQFEKSVGILAQLKGGDWKGALGELLRSDLPDDVAQEMARIYFDPKTGASKLQKLIPILEQYTKNKQIAGATGQVAGRATDAGLQQGESMLQRSGERKGFQPRQTEKSETLGKGKSVPSSYDAQNPVANQASFKRTSSNGYRPNPLFAVRRGMQDGKPNVQIVEQEIDKDPYFSAVYETESGRNPKAKNPASSASGGFQLISSTAKALGVEDPFDLAQNFQGMRKLTEAHRSRFGNDPMLLYSAHYLGAPLLTKVLTGQELSEKEQRIVDDLKRVALPRFEKIYNRIAKRDSEVIET